MNSKYQSILSFEFTGNFDYILRSTNYIIFMIITTRVCLLPNVFEINEIKYKEKMGQLGTKIY